jgi:hypothetical protein
MKVLFRVLAQLFFGQLTLRPGHIERVLEKTLRSNNGINLLLKHRVGRHGFSY